MNKYLDELIKLNKELEAMTDEQIMALVDEANISSEDCDQFKRLEQYILDKDSKSEPKSKS